MKRLAIGAIVAALSLTACTSPSQDPSPSTTAVAPKIRVVTTTPMLTDFATTVGGGAVDVYGLVEPGLDPHDYEPSPADITAIARADLILKSGLGLENWLDETIDSAESHAVVVDTSDGVAVRRNSAGQIDPHAWHDPNNAKIMVANVRRGLERVDPAQAALYASTQGAYAAQLDALDRETRQALQRLTTKKVVTDHDSLGYFIDAYKLEFVGSVFPNFDSQAELSSAALAALVEKVKAQRVPAVFTENSLPAAAAETLAKEAGVKVVQGTEALYGDSLGPPGSSADTYLKMERHNVAVLVNNLG